MSFLGSYMFRRIETGISAKRDAADAAPAPTVDDYLGRLLKLHSGRDRGTRSPSTGFCNH
jgi:hypothetical protein